MNDNKVLKVKIDWRVISLALVLIILAMFALWRPWEGNSERKITITGEASVEATPDEFVFYPRYERSGADTQALKAELATFGTQLQTKLKELGVKEDDITLDSSSYDYGIAKPEGDSTPTVTLSVTITTPTRELAQKVQDYLATTDAKGQLTAQAQFSDAKRRELENQARDKAIEDARGKADRTARNLDARLGKVVEVKDQQGFGIEPFARDQAASSQGSSSLPVTPGKDTVTFTVEVVFELR